MGTELNDEDGHGERDEALDAVERAEAAELARALERGSAGRALPDDALETAALLRYSRDQGELSEDKLRSIFEEAMRGATPARQSSAALGRARWLWWLPALSAALAVAALIVVGRHSLPPEPGSASTQGRHSPRRLPAAAALPVPRDALLRAQAAVATRGGSAELARLDAEMHAYRASLLSSLEARYRP